MVVLWKAVERWMLSTKRNETPGKFRARSPAVATCDKERAVNARGTAKTLGCN